MALVTYWLQFGSGNPTLVSGLAPTFISFMNSAGGATTPPGITEPGLRGIYQFSYEPLGPIAFTVDGATTGLANSDRYISGSLDVSDTDSQGIGNVNSSYGDENTDPTTIFGFLKRIDEVLEGYQEYNKAGAELDFYDKGASTLLRSFSVSDSITLVTRTP